MKKTLVCQKIIPYLCFVIILVGILLRIFLFLQNYSLYTDEIGLFNNIKNATLNVFDLDFGQKQVAPLFFLFFSKLFYNLTSEQQIGLKIFPLICSIISVISFYMVSKKILKKQITLCFAVLLFSLNWQLVFYSQSFKQYSTEVLVALCAYLLILKIDFNKITLKRAFYFGFLSSIAILFSFSFLYLLTGFILYFIFSKTEQNLQEKAKLLFAFFLPIGFVSILMFSSSFRHIFTSNYSIYLSDWQTSDFFFPHSYLTYKGLINYIFFYPNNNFVVLFFTLAAIIGGASFFKENKFYFFILSLPIVIAYIVGMLYISPFADRLILFLFPAFFILVSKPLDLIESKSTVFKSLIILNVVGLIVTSNLFVFDYKISAVMSTAKEYYSSLLKNDLKKNEYLFVQSQTYFAFPYYEKDNFIIKNIIPEHNVILFNDELVNPFELAPKRSVINLFIANYIWAGPKYNAKTSEWIKLYCSPLKVDSYKTGTYYKCLNKY